MALKNTFTQSEILERSRIALQNVESNPVIKPLMEALGYDTAKIDEGKALLNTAQTQFDANREFEDTKTRASKAFESKRSEIETLYANDRKKTKVVLASDTLALKELGIAGTMERTYVKWLESVHLFYNTLNKKPELVAKLAIIKITPTHVTDALASMATLEELKAARVQTQGFAQNATKTKDQSFKVLEKWMGTFFAFAKIALEGEPQLLESLGKFVRS